MDFSKFTIIIPTLNEEGYIGTLIDFIFSNYPTVNCLVVDDGSKDRTQEIIHKLQNNYPNLQLIDRGKESVKGLCASVIEGIVNCLTQYFVVIDGDGQHPPEFIKYCFANLELGAQLSIGTREPYGTRWSFSRIATSYSASLLAKIRLLFCGVTINDPMSGFFGGKTKFVQQIYYRHKKSFMPRGYKILFDILKKLPKDCRISGFYYPFGLRVHDASKFSLKVIISFLLSIIK